MDKGREHSIEERGIFLLELSIILPALLLVFFLGVGLTDTVRTSQLMGAMAKEAGNSISRTCITLGVVDDGCVADIVGQMNQFADLRLNGAEVMVSVYRYDSGTASLVSSHRHTSPGTESSRYNTANIASQVTFITNPLTNLATVSEVFYERTQFFGFPVVASVLPKDMYETAIY